MNYVTTQDLVKLIVKMTDVIIENEVPFCELDSVAGDGDFGMSLAKGFKVLRQEWANINKDNVGAMLKECSLIILENCGGASGPIWGSAFSGAAKATKGKEQLDVAEFAEMFSCAVESIMKRGGAKKGDKTLLDALIPATEALKACATNSCTILEAMKSAAVAAVAGAESTKNMVASKGRASYVGERSLQYPDAGAHAIGVILTELYKSMIV